MMYAFTHFKGIGEILNEYFLLRKGCFGNRQGLLIKRNHRFHPFFVRGYGIRQKVGVYLANVTVLFQFGQVLAILDYNTVICATFFMVDNIVVIPLKLTTPNIQNRATRTTKHGSEVFRFGNLASLRERILGFEREIMRHKRRCE